MLDKAISICFTFAFGLTIMTQGPSLNRVTVTAASVLYLVGAILVAIKRKMSLQPFFPHGLIKVPAIYSLLMYVSLGLLSGFFAWNKTVYLKDIVCKIIIVLVPMYLCMMGPRKVDDVKRILIAYMPFGVIIAVVSLVPALTSKFEDPSYALGMHKNHIGGCGATTCIIAIAMLVTTARKNMRIIAILVLTMGMVGIVAAQSRAALCSVVLATFLILARKGANPKHLLIFATICVLGLCALYKLMPEKAIKHVVTNEKWSANGIRMREWGELVPILCRDPFVMHGWGNPLLTDEGWAFGDGASVVFADWIQLGIQGSILLVFMMVCSLYLPWQNAGRIRGDPVLEFINYACFGIILSRFLSGLFDTFWIARGIMLHTWTAIGMALFVRLILDQREAQARKAVAAAQSAAYRAGKPKLLARG